MIFTHSGNSGDIIFSLPTINYLTGGKKEATLYIKPAKYVYGNQYDFCKDFLLQQDCIKEVLSFEPTTPDDWNYFKWPGLENNLGKANWGFYDSQRIIYYDNDLDKARLQRNRGRVHIIKRYFDAFGINEDWRKPWLKIDNEKPCTIKYALIHLTPRWNGLQYDWKKIYFEAINRHNGLVYFIGLKSEWEDFCNRFHWLPWQPTENLLEMVRLIRDCDALYCNQTVGLAIAQGLGKEYYLVKNKDKTNCHLFTNNEHLLGTEYLAPYNTLNMPPDSHIIREK